MNGDLLMDGMVGPEMGLPDNNYPIMEENPMDGLLDESEDSTVPTRSKYKTSKKKSKNKKDKERLDIVKRIDELSGLGTMDRITMGGGELEETTMSIEDGNGNAILTAYITEWKPRKKRKVKKELK